jgi:hypothetical protein
VRNAIGLRVEAPPAMPVQPEYEERNAGEMREAWHEPASEYRQAGETREAWHDVERNAWAPEVVHTDVEPLRNADGHVMEAWHHAADAA